MATVLLRGGTIYSPAQKICGEKMNILIEDGKIARLDCKQASADEIIDCEGLAVCPGFVDMHTHLRDPGQTHKEDIISGCRAAAAGGVTSLLAMPNTSPAADNPQTVKYILEKAKGADARVYTAASITRGLDGREATNIEEMKAAGAIALTDDGRPVENTRILADALLECARLNIPLVSHCEDLFLARGGKLNEGEISQSLGVKGIPAAAEDCDTARLIALAAAYGVPVHICHISTSTSAALVRDAKRRGVRVTAETAPHYISLTDKALLSRDANFRMNPPLRTEKDRLALIEALCDGTIDAIATDHAPHTPEEKADFLNAPNGCIGMETSFSVCNTFLVQPGHMTLTELVNKMSTRPAQLLGIDAGTLETGKNADIAIIDTQTKYTLNAAELHGKSRNTPFASMELCGRVVRTLLGGRTVYSLGE